MFLNFFQIHWAESTQGACVHCDVFISHANVGWVSVYAVLFTGLCSLSRYDIKIKILIFLSLQMLNSICVKIHLLFMIFFFFCFFQRFYEERGRPIGCCECSTWFGWTTWFRVFVWFADIRSEKGICRMVCWTMNIFYNERSFKFWTFFCEFSLSRFSNSLNSILGAGLAVLSIPCESHSYLVVFSSAAYGLCLGCWYLLIPVLLADFFGTESISSSYGLIRMFQSIGAISIPPLAGYLKDLTGGYEMCFYCMGACMVLGSVPLLVLIVETNNNEANAAAEDSDVSTVTNSHNEKTASLKS